MLVILLSISTLIQGPENLILYVQDTHCKHILIGCRHDNGYVPNLDPLNTSDIYPRISIIQHYRPGTKHLDLPFKVVELDGVFRGAELTLSSVKRSISPSLEHTIPRIQSTAQEFFKVRSNQYGERIDIPLPQVDRIMLRSVSERQKSQAPGLCNTHYIFGPGSCTGHCKYSHQDYLESSEVLALAIQARDAECRDGELKPITLPSVVSFD